jgi:spermidine synthase
MTSNPFGTNQRAGVETLLHEPTERAVSLVFFVSGLAGLIFEVVWFERCRLIFGNSVWAVSLVLSSFMGGLAVGNAIVGWAGHRITRYLRVYAILEAIVGVSGIVLTYGLTQLGGSIGGVARLDAVWVVNLVRLVTAFALLVVPTTAMGATLPVLVSAVCRGRPSFGWVLGRLYGWNTLGAVCGVMGAELLLIRRFGLMGSAWTAAFLNVGAAAAALWMSRAEPRRSGDDVAPEPAPSRPAVWRPLACAFLAGGNLLALEVIWFRFLSMFVVASTLALSLMLAAVLTAIGLGGLAASAWLRRRPRAVYYVAPVALIAACVSAESYVAFRFLARGPWAAEWYRILWFGCALTFPTSLLSGVMFALLGETIKRDVVAEARAAGWMTLANTSGGMVGPLIAAFVLLPLLGMERSFFALAVVYAAVGLLAVRDDVRGSRAAVAACGAAAVGAVVVLASFPFGLMTSTYFPRAVQRYTSDGSQIIATREGPSETVLLLQKAWMGKPLFHRLVTNGFSMSGTLLTGKRYMRYFAYWPMLFHQGPLGRVLVICYGVGVTAGAVTDIQSITSIQVVEISRDVAAMSRVIYPPDERPLSDPRVHLRIEDGRTFLQSTHERFDLITGEPPPPLTPGTVNLYTREYFQLVHDRLSDRGMTTYWLPVARRGEYDVRAIIRAFCDVFEDCSLWNGTPLDWMLTGSRQVGPVAKVQFSALWDDPIIGSRLREIGFELPQQIGATFLGDAAYLRGLTRETLPLTDNYPQRLRPLPTRLSLADSADGFTRGEIDFIGNVIDPLRARQAFKQSEFVRRLWPEALANQTLPLFDLQRIINRIMWDGASPLLHIEELHQLLTKTSLHELPLWALGSEDVQQRIADTGDDGSYMVSYVRGVRALAARHYSAAAGFFADSERRGLRTSTSRPLLVYALSLASEVDAASRLAQGPMPNDPARRHFWTWLGSEFGIGPGAIGRAVSKNPAVGDDTHGPGLIPRAPANRR